MLACVVCEGGGRGGLRPGGGRIMWTKEPSCSKCLRMTVRQTDRYCPEHQTDQSHVSCTCRRRGTTDGGATCSYLSNQSNSSPKKLGFFFFLSSSGRDTLRCLHTSPALQRRQMAFNSGWVVHPMACTQTLGDLLNDLK